MSAEERQPSTESPAHAPHAVATAATGTSGVAEVDDKYRMLFHSIPLPVFIYDLETLRIREVNNAAIRHYGYSQEEFRALTLKDIRPAEDVPALLEILATLPPHVPNAGMWRHRKKDGSLIYVEVGSHRITYEGRPARLAVASDVTERLRAQEELLRVQSQLRHAQKMEAVGRLAGGVAHDFNNLLTIMLGYCESLLERAGPEHPDQLELREVIRAGERAADLTRQLLTFSRQQPCAPRLVCLNGVVSDMERLVRRVIGEDVELDVRLDPDLGEALLDPSQIEQLILNLVVNARDAMPHGGRLTIATANVTLDEKYVTQQSGALPGPAVMLAVTDSGCGMDEATRGRIFEPFFTTKEVGKGTGLGLATVYGIVQQSRGHIAVTSEPGLGTAFRIYFPCTGVREGAALASLPPGTPVRGRTIVLVDDEDGVRDLSRSALQGYGCTVYEARNGLEALQVCEQIPGPIDLLVTDIVMPLMNGRQVAERLLPLRPGLKVLYISGFTDDADVRRGVFQKECFFLQKPFSPTALVHTVRQILEAV